jgi:hypothetical protein
MMGKVSVAFWNPVKWRAAFIALVVTLVCPVMAVKADGLVPCDQRSAGFVEDLSDDSKTPSRGEVALSYLDLPGLFIGWGLQIVRVENRFELRTVQFRRDLHGGVIEIRPHVFGENPVQPDPLVRTIAVSAGLVEKLRAIAIMEIAHADQANARMGLDGEGFYFYADGKCAWAWSPDEGSHLKRLADIFQDLKTQALLPTRLMQLFWERRTVARLNHYSGSMSMAISEYLVLIGIAIAIVAVAALPLLIAWVVTFFSKGLKRKRRFVIVSGALSYGFMCFIGLVLLPLVLLGIVVSAQLDVDGHSELSIVLDVIVKYSLYVILNAGLVFAMAVPIYLRRKWAKFPTPMESG